MQRLDAAGNRSVDGCRRGRGSEFAAISYQRRNFWCFQGEKCRRPNCQDRIIAIASATTGDRSKSRWSEGKDEEEFPLNA